MTYTQLTEQERYRLADLRADGWPPSALAAHLGRHRTTIWRELRRNRSVGNGYKPHRAHSLAVRRRRRSRRNRRLWAREWRWVVRRLRRQWSPEQIAGEGRRSGRLRISRETIYRYLAADHRTGGRLTALLRGSRKQRRRRLGSVRRRGTRLGRPLETRPGRVAARREIGHWEIDTVLGGRGRACIVTLVERVTGYVLIGKLRARTAAAFTARVVALVRQQRRPVRTITADNGTELTDYRTIEARTGARFYFAAPYHAWERGTNENTNGLIRQYLPKGASMEHLTQQDCTRIARHLNTRPRKRLGYRTPEACYVR
jgi:IS30 family transposase